MTEAQANERGYFLRCGSEGGACGRPLQWYILNREGITLTAGFPSRVAALLWLGDAHKEPGDWHDKPAGGGRVMSHTKSEPPALNPIEVTPREEEFLRAAQEWAAAKLSEASADYALAAARRAHEEATRERQKAGAQLEEAQQALLADYERDELDQREAAP